MKKQIHRDVWVGAILLAFSLGTLALAMTISGEASVLPSALCVMMAVCGAAVLVKGLQMTREADGEFQYAMTLKSSKTAFLFMLFIFVYYLAFKYIGYWVATPVFLLFTQKYLRVKSWKVNVIITVSYLIITYVLFVVILKLPIYKVGVLGPYFRFV